MRRFLIHLFLTFHVRNHVVMPFEEGASSEVSRTAAIYTTSTYTRYPIKHLSREPYSSHVAMRSRICLDAQASDSLAPANYTMTHEPCSRALTKPGSGGATSESHLRI